MSMTPTAHKPNLEAQRTAMKRLAFLIGEWAGETSVARGPGLVLDLIQTEVVQLKLDGLVLVIEGIGRSKPDGAIVLHALGLISFDDVAGSYRMRAYNDGSWLDADVTLLDDDRSLAWGFSLGDISTKSVLRVNEHGEWTESAEISIGTRPPQRLMDLVVRPSTRG
jgi:hypothetical protein